MIITGKTRFSGVIGWPVTHSLSPLIHNYWYEKYTIDSVYLPLPSKPKALSIVIPALAQMGCVGVNLTIPHKEMVLLMLDDLDNTAKTIGAVNTITFENGKCFGYNTDIYGFWQNLTEHAPDMKKEVALVIGAGGAARSVIKALDEAGFSNIYVMNRTLEKAENMQNFSSKVIPMEWFVAPDILENVDLVVNTTSLGMKNQPSLELALGKCPPHAIITDIVYNPLKTPLLEAAERLGLKTVDGLGMLLYQAQKAFEIWFGILPEVTKELRAKLKEQL